jgi:hypothetical protein
MESSGAGAGAKSGAAATALNAYRAPLGTSRDRSQLRTGSSDTMSTNSNMSSASGDTTPHPRFLFVTHQSLPLFLSFSFQWQIQSSRDLLHGKESYEQIKSIRPPLSSPFLPLLSEEVESAEDGSVTIFVPSGSSSQ